jgi:CheY-like chemotaxis protein
VSDPTGGAERPLHARVTEALLAHRGKPVCGRCVVAATGARKTSVEMVLARLEGVIRLDRRYGVCAVCGQRRLTSRLDAIADGSVAAAPARAVVAPAAAAAPAVGRPSPGSTVLVVDDTPAMRYATAKVLERAGYDVREAGSGLMALELAAGIQPAVIVLDVVLPDLDGLQVCRRLKQSSTTARIPVLHKTAVRVNETDREAGLAAGAAEYLWEPVAPEVLVAVVDRLAGQRAS